MALSPSLMGLLEQFPLGGGKMGGQFPAAPSGLLGDGVHSPIPGVHDAVGMNPPPWAIAGNPAGQQGGGMMGGLFGNRGEPNYALMALGQGIAGGDVGGAFRDYAPIMAAGRKSNRTKQWLINKGMSQEDAEVYASEPALLKEIFDGQKDNFINVGDNLYNAKTGEWIQAPGGGSMKAPQIAEFFDEAGAPYKAQWNAQTGSWDKMGGSRVSGATESQRNRVSQVNQSIVAVNSALDRYQELVEKSGLSVVPGAEQDNLTQVRQGVMLQLKELFNLGVLNGPDLQLMQGMLYNPVVDGSGGYGEMAGQGLTALGVGGSTAERSKNSVTELKRMLNDIYQSVQTTNPAVRNDRPTIGAPGSDDPLGILGR